VAAAPFASELNSVMRCATCTRRNPGIFATAPVTQLSYNVPILTLPRLGASTPWALGSFNHVKEGLSKEQNAHLVSRRPRRPEIIDAVIHLDEYASDCVIIEEGRYPCCSAQNSNLFLRAVACKDGVISYWLWSTLVRGRDPSKKGGVLDIIGALKHVDKQSE
jgi:hypothetical protein